MSRRCQRWVRRYHPIAPDTVHRYQVAFRFGQHESFRDLTRNAWRWAWDTLKPAVTYIDVDLVRRVLTDHLVAQAATIDGRTAIPFVLSTVVDQLQWNWTMVAMGFVGKNLECADQLLREGDRDTTERGRKMRADRPRRHRVDDPGAADRAAAGHRVRPGHRQAARPRLARPVAAQRHRGHARAGARLPPGARAGTRAPGVARLGEDLRRLAREAAARGRVVPAAVEARQQRGRGTVRARRATPPCRCS